MTEKIRAKPRCSISSITIAILAVIFILPSLNHNAFGATITELRREIEEKNIEIGKLEDEETAYRNAITVKKKEEKTLKNQISVIDSNVKRLNSDISITSAKIQKVKLEINLLKKEITAKEEEIDSQKKSLAEVLRLFEERESENLLAVMIKHSSISSFFTSINNLVSLEKKFQERLISLKQVKTDLSSKKIEAENKKGELDSLSQELTDKKYIQNRQKQEKSGLLTKTKNQENLFRNMLKQTEEKQEEILRELEELEEKLRLLIDPASLPRQKSGFFAWPAKGRVSQLYGRTSFVVRSDFYKFHNGIDIANFAGTPVYAAYSGKIKMTGDTDRFCPDGAYGRFILIDHENNLSTFYSHLSLIKVSAGQTVDRGDPIGYIGTTGLTTGPHLHFTVYDSRTVEIKQSRVCGQMPYGGSIDPMNYL